VSYLSFVELRHRPLSVLPVIRFALIVSIIRKITVNHSNDAIIACMS